MDFLLIVSRQRTPVLPDAMNRLPLRFRKMPGCVNTASARPAPDAPPARLKFESHATF